MHRIQYQGNVGIDFSRYVQVFESLNPWDWDCIYFPFQVAVSFNKSWRAMQ